MARVAPLGPEGEPYVLPQILTHKYVKELSLKLGPPAAPRPRQAEREGRKHLFLHAFTRQVINGEDGQHT